MILPGDIIKEFVDQGLISVLPKFDEKQLRPFGLRVHLSSRLLVPEGGQIVDLSSSEPSEPRHVPHMLDQGPIKLKPGDFVLGSTIEAFKISPTLMCKLDGRSTLARLGLMVHCTSSIIDGNHLEHRTIVVEIKNLGSFDILLPFGIGIGMVTFERVVGEASLRLEQEQYEGQTDVLPANLQFRAPRYSGLADDDNF